MSSSFNETFPELILRAQNSGPRVASCKVNCVSLSLKDDPISSRLFSKRLVMSTLLEEGSCCSFFVCYVSKSCHDGTCKYTHVCASSKSQHFQFELHDEQSNVFKACF